MQVVNSDLLLRFLSLLLRFLDLDLLRCRLRSRDLERDLDLRLDEVDFFLPLRFFCLLLREELRVEEDEDEDRDEPEELDLLR